MPDNHNFFRNVTPPIQNVCIKRSTDITFYIIQSPPRRHPPQRNIFAIKIRTRKQTFQQILKETDVS